MRFKNSQKDVRNQRTMMSPNKFSQNKFCLATTAGVYHWALRGVSLWTASGGGVFK